MNKTAKTCLLFGALTFAWSLSLWLRNYDEFSSVDSIGFAIYGALALVVQIAICIAAGSLARKTGQWGILYGAAALLITFNIYTLNLLHYEFVAGLHPAFLVGILAGFLFIFFILFVAATDSKVIFGLVLGLAILFTAQVSGEYVYAYFKRQRAIEKFAHIPPYFKFPDFKERPNVYLIGFDAMMPEYMAQKFLGLEKLDYVTAMHEEGMRVFDNAFADMVPTTRSFNALAAMDMGYIKKLPGKVRSLFDTGEIPAPLYEMFRHNGYKVQFIYDSSHFGRKEKAGVDYYGVSEDDGICNFVDNKLGLMAYCHPAIVELHEKIFGALAKNSEHPKFLFDRIRVTAASGEPWLTVSYIFSPGHTAIAFNTHKPEDFKDYGADFKARRAPQAAIYLRELMKTIKETDPKAIVVIFGDHGAYMSRSLPYQKELPADSPMSRIEVFQDRHGIAAAIYPADFCPEEFKEPFTTMRIGRRLAKCLSGGQDPMPSDYLADDDFYKEFMHN